MIDSIPTSKDWIMLLHKGDEKAYKLFFEAYYQVLGVFALKYVKEQVIAEDIVNDVIIELYSRRLKFENITALKSFLYQSVKNRSLNYLRHIRAQERYLNTTLPQEEDTFFLDNIIEEEVYFLLKKAVNELPDPVRQIYELSLQGSTNEEIAAQLNLTIDSVKAYKKRGKNMLKDKLKGLIYFLAVMI